MSPDLRAAYDDLFAVARQADILTVARVKLYRQGKRWRGECPICHASKGKRAGGAFSVDPVARAYRCFTDGHPGGDVIELERLLGGHRSIREAAEHLAPMEAQRLAELERASGGDPGARIPRQARPTPQPRPLPPPDPDDVAKARFAASLWREALPAGGSLVETYLQHRRLSGDVLASVANGVRFHPAAYHHGPRGGEIRYPAMVALVQTPAGATGGVHVTYLRDNGCGKARTEPAKRMWGPQTRDSAPGGVWLTPKDAPGPLLVGEGIESTASAAVLLGRPCRMLATLSLGHLQGGWLTDAWGRVDADCIAGDPERAPLTWPEPPNAPWGEVIIAVDRDMKPVRVKARRAVGGTYERDLGPEDRARICAALAEQAWRRAGATTVSSIAPAAGRDFNDELIARQGGVSG